MKETCRSTGNVTALILAIIAFALVMVTLGTLATRA